MTETKTTKPSKAEHILGKIRDRLAARGILGGEIRISRRGVPHLVVRDLSACYFGKTRLVRVFTNYGSDPQEKFDFKEWPQAAAFLEERLSPAQPAPVAKPVDEAFPESREDFMNGWTHP